MFILCVASFASCDLVGGSQDGTTPQDSTTVNQDSVAVSDSSVTANDTTTAQIGKQ